jgi:hypothetical protein
VISAAMSMQGASVWFTTIYRAAGHRHNTTAQT